MDRALSPRTVMVLCAVWLVGCATETPPPVTLPTSAPPPQGWVLWESTWIKGDTNETWRLQDGYGRYQDCEDMLKISVDAAATTAEVVRRAGSIVVLKQPYGEERVRYHCLPATIDPRK